jgi:hypothetical protein
MMIRHCVEESNVDDQTNVVIDATKMRHVTIAGGKIESMSGLIDPASHLNLDYPDHWVNICVIAEKLEVGARVKMDSDGLIFATVSREAYGHFGFVDYTQRLVNMINAVKANQELAQKKKLLKKEAQC